MYKSNYSQVHMGLAAMKNHRSKEKSCGYYMKIFFFFSSLIQSLIIASLVLFLVYGQPQQTVEERKVHELEQSYSKLSLENIALRAKEKNLTQKLNVTLTTKIIDDTHLFRLRGLANTSALNIDNLLNKWQCEDSRAPVSHSLCPPSNPGGFYLDHQLKETQELLKLVRANFSEKMQIMSLELENAHKARNNYLLDAIELRRDKSYLQERIDTYETKCKEEFVQSLQGIPNVTREFLKRVDDLFSKHASFQLTCEKQSTQLEDIRTNCSSLSTDVENKLQQYLNKVGDQVTTILGENAKYKVENKRLKEDITWCTRNRSALIEVNRKDLKLVQQKFDETTEKLLLDLRRITGEKNLKDQLLNLKEDEIKRLDTKLRDLNASLTSCKAFPKSQFPGSTSLLFGSGPGSSGLGTSRIAGGSVGSSGIGLGGGIGLQKPDLGRSAVSAYGSVGGAGVGSTGSGASTMFGGGKVTSGSDPLLAAQMNQLVKELLRYAQTK
ncbi:plasmalemma vesicle associated protein a isoform X2 [Brachyhypopomus gauderio]|uniref:plasmalemma vesicle associated protein a isoform X2 n=1 Tax=Brachyhypopomus gauderio TaxID=698409 RepID=UPI004041A68F